jgi:antitoxin ParD1/3/4
MFWRYRNNKLESGDFLQYDYFIPKEPSMSAIEKRTISLPSEHATFIDAKVASGAYASASEVVRAGLRALQERDEAVERWLRNEVAPTYDKMKIDPKRGIPGSKVFAGIRARHVAHPKAKV